MPKFSDSVVALTIAGVATYDVYVGAMMLWSQRPWEMHGEDTVWTNAFAGVETADGTKLSVEQYALLGALRRCGGFSLLVGAISLAWLIVASLGNANSRRKWLTLQLLLYMFMGAISFAQTDAEFFPDTPYLLAKRIIGVLWGFAAVLQLQTWRNVDAKKSD